MEWNKYTISTTTQAVDAISGVLMDLGIYGIEVQDNVPISEADRQKMFIDILPVLPPDDGTAYVTFYVQQDEGQVAGFGMTVTGDDGLEACVLPETELLEKLREAMKALSGFLDIGEGTIQKEVTADEDWNANWKAYFKPFSIARFLIKPTWETMQPKAEQYVIDIDPGLAFGTGRHETTKLCLEQLDANVKAGDRVLDLGCGSGILSIAAYKLGADCIVSTDIDPAAIEATVENEKLNSMDTKHCSVYLGNVLEEIDLQETIGNGYDVVVANILADVIVPLADMVGKFMKPGALFISSGILYTKEKDVVEAVQRAADLELESVTRDGDWVCVCASKVCSRENR